MHRSMSTAQLAGLELSLSATHAHTRTKLASTKRERADHDDARDVTPGCQILTEYANFDVV